MDVRKLAAGALLYLCALEARAVTPCDLFDRAVEESLMEISHQHASSVGDDSAPREVLRQSLIANELALIRIQLDLAARNQCAPRKTPINEMKYLSDAVRCRTRQLAGDKDPPACNRETWTGVRQTS